MSFRRWQDLTTDDFAALAANAVAVLPVAAVEQHGPHLPVGTDALIAEGMIGLAAEQADGEPEDILVLPQISVGASLEHERFAGTLSVSSAEMADRIVGIARGVKAAGLERLVIVSSHGGNVAAMTDAALRCRAELGLLAVYLTWSRLGLPDGAVGDDERAYGVHGGFVETSLMLNFRPDLVRMDEAQSFGSLQRDLAGDFELLRAYGPVGFGWMAQDLNGGGAVGDAASANAGAGRAIAGHQAGRFVRLLRETAAADLSKMLK